MNSKIKVLSVEDDKRWQDTIKEITSMLGYDVEFVTTSKDAMFKLKRSFYHVALLDKRLEEENSENSDGLSIATVIAGLNEGTQIIVYTAYGNISDSREAFRKINVMDFIGKDMPLSEIRDALKNAAEAASQKFIKPTGMPVKILATRGNALDEFLSTSASREKSPSRAEVIETFAKRLLTEFRPLLLDRRDAKLLTLKPAQVLQVRFWSRMLGGPIAVWFGKPNEIKTVLQKTDLDEDFRSELNINHKLSELFDSHNFPEFGGAVFELNNVEFEEFESSFDFHAYS